MWQYQAYNNSRMQAQDTPLRPMPPLKNKCNQQPLNDQQWYKSINLFPDRRLAPQNVIQHPIPSKHHHSL